MNSNRIKTFAGPYRFLSNFYPADVFYEDEVWPTVEHAYQAAKTHDIAWKQAIRDVSRNNPGKAKRLGSAISKRSDLLRPDWFEVNQEIMAELLLSKFYDPHLRDLLRDTGDAELIEGNMWGDTYWGVCRGVGENWLGRLLMVVREFVR